MEIMKLQSPLHVGLFENCQITENLYDNALPVEFIDAINSAVRSHPLTRASEDGLIHYFSYNNEIYDAFVKDHVKYVHPSVQIVDGALRLVLEVGSDCLLPDSIITIIMDDMERQCKSGWGEEIEGVEISLPLDSVLHETDLSVGLRRDMERRYPDYPFYKLNNPSLGLYLYNVEFTKLLESE